MQVLGLDGSHDGGPGGGRGRSRRKGDEARCPLFPADDNAGGFTRTSVRLLRGIYIDDVLVHGSDEDEHIGNLRLVFQRVREKKVTINPVKCIFGADEVEFVGRVLDAKGTTFSRTKFDYVVEFIKPSNMKELRSFVGLVNYFRDHIQNHSIITQPLQVMITEGAKTKMVRVPGKKPMQHIVWTPEAEASFAEIKLRINACPKLFFMDGKLPIFLHTDASDYAIGAYLFQVKEGKEISIRFMSKTVGIRDQLDPFPG